MVLVRPAIARLENPVLYWPLFMTGEMLTWPRGIACRWINYWPAHLVRGAVAIRRLATAIVLAGCASRSPRPATVSGAPPALRGDAGIETVLFVGNSLTYANDLPGMVEALAHVGVGQSITVKMLALPNYSLEDHWKRGTAARLIAGSRWDVVVLQQGPSAAEASRTLLLDYVRRFASIIEASGGRPALYMVWPTADRLDDFPRSSASYRQAAAAVHGLLFPVGDAWRAAWRRDSAVQLYSADGLHPSIAGSYLAALVIVQTLTGRSPLGMPDTVALASGARIVLPRATAMVLRAAAADVVE
jgi:hypothetical protein